MELKLVISDPKTGKTMQKELKDDTAAALKGKKLGETFKGELIDFTGYEFKITGGSDYAGFPMRKDIPGSGRAKVLEVSGIGINNKRKYRSKEMKGLRTMKGMRQRKTVAGNTIHMKTAQVNVMITKAGKEDFFPKKEEPAKEGAPAAEAKPEEKKEAPAEKKEEPKKEEAEKPKEKKEEAKPAEDKSKEAHAKEAAKQEEKPKPEEKKESPAKEEKPAEKKE